MFAIIVVQIWKSIVYAKQCVIVNCKFEHRNRQFSRASAILTGDVQLAVKSDSIRCFLTIPSFSGKESYFSDYIIVTVGTVTIKYERGCAFLFGKLISSVSPYFEANNLAFLQSEIDRIIIHSASLSHIPGQLFVWLSSIRFAKQCNETGFSHSNDRMPTQEIFVHCITNAVICAALPFIGIKSARPRQHRRQENNQK